MDVIQQARQLGRAIQEDERYLSLKLAQQRNDQDSDLQVKISAFNAYRAELTAEIQKPEKDGEAVKELDAKVREVYGEIFQNENMIAYNQAREELQQLVSFINQIITGSTEGRDPDSIEFQESCGGNCSGCSGCG